VNYFDEFESAKTFMLSYFLLPVKRFLGGVPWIWGVGVMTVVGWRCRCWSSPR
jgi:glycine betaine/proline transport system permease protein